MQAFKKLLGQSALYGISSILGRLLNYFLTPLHTDAEVFAKEEYGVISVVYAYLAFATIIYSFGMETAFFKFTSSQAGKDRSTYRQAMTLLVVLGLIISSLLMLFAADIATYLGIPDHRSIIHWIAAILFIDAFLAIPYARLRLENKALKFVFAKLFGIIIIFFLNFFFLKFAPAWQHSSNEILSRLGTAVVGLDLGVGFVFLANLIGSLASFLVLLNYLKDFNFYWNGEEVKKMLSYAYPIVIMGLAGISIETFDKILIKDWLPDNFYPHMNSLEATAVYSAAYKLSVLMALAIQAFRYAGEPFFFKIASDPDSPKTFAGILKYFTYSCILILMGVSFYADFIASFFIRSEALRQGLFIVPILLLAKLFFGMYNHVSIWFKLSGKTRYGAYFTLAGAAVSLVLNLILIPIIGYPAAAIAALVGYLLMLALAYAYGQKHYPIPYPMKNLALHIFGSSMLVAIHYFIPWWSNYMAWGVGMMVLLAYAYIIYADFKKAD
ncbi:MAG: polysaccharide biosynthesis C-terminal domain-containing protein [Cyclobacteriaceae bacterium]|nr:polysaccharide biosynthesis C-terminal domain-containing protein [Cyclobacteriaceae bacterium]